VRFEVVMMALSEVYRPWRCVSGRRLPTFRNVLFPSWR